MNPTAPPLRPPPEASSEQQPLGPEEEGVPSTIPAELLAHACSRPEGQRAYRVERRQGAGIVPLGVCSTLHEAFSLAATVSEDSDGVTVFEIAAPSGAEQPRQAQTLRVWKHVGKGVWTASDDRGSASRL